MIFPGLAALLELLFLLSGTNPDSVLKVGASPLWVLGYVLAKSDAGGQFPAAGALYQLLLCFFLVSWLLVPRPLPEPARRLLVPWVLALVVALVTVWKCGHFGPALWKWSGLFLWMGVVIAVSQLTSQEDPAWFLPVAQLTVLTVVFCGLVTHLLNPPDNGRLMGPFHHPNMSAAFFLLGLPLLWNRKQVYGRLISASLLWTALFLTGSRGAAAASLLAYGLVFAGRLQFLVALLALGFFFMQLWWLSLLILVIGFWDHLKTLLLSCRSNLKPLCLALLVSLCLLTGVTQEGPGRISEGVASDSLRARLEFWSAAAAMSIDRFPLGVGGDGFRRHYPRYQPGPELYSKFPHSLPLGLMAEWGWVVTLLLIAGLVGAYRARAEEQRARYLGWALVAFSFQACVSVHLQFPVIMIWFGILLGRFLRAPLPDLVTAARSRWSIRPLLLLQYLALLPLTALSLYFLLGVYARHYASVGRLATKLDNHVAARDLYREAARLDPWESDFPRLAAQAGLQLTEGKPEALVEAKQALRLDPNRAVTHNLLGRLKDALEQDGRPDLQRALELDGVNYPSFYTHLANSELQRGNREKALLILRGGWDRFPVTLPEVVHRVRRQEMRNQMSEMALVYAYLLLEEKENSPGDETVFRQGVLLSGRSRESELAWFLYLWKTGKEEQAREGLSRLDREHPDWEPLQRVLEKVNRS